MLRKLEKYEIHEEIGHGGMATVYRAHDTVLDREVALKVMHPHLRGAEEARKRFHREARSVARLRHPKVLEIYDFSGEGSEESYIAMEMLTGPTLKSWREDLSHELPAEIAACIVIQICEALEAAHAANIVHRDVKPENVLLHENRTLKLTDFGIADMMDAISMTATGQILGSPGHMAPEQIEGRDSDVRTDLFSLGTVLYYLATGRLPFTGRNPHQVLKRIVDGEYADPLRVNPAIGGPLREIIVRSLERELEDRYQTAAQMREELCAFVAKIGIDDPDQTLADYLREPEKTGAELTKRAIDALIDEGSRASDAGDVPTALDRYNRVLALDEGNERVLKLIERVGMDRRRRMVLMAGAGLCAFGALAGGVAWAVWPDGSEAGDPMAQITDDTDAGVLTDEAAEDDAGPTGEDAGRAEGDAGPGDAGPPRQVARVTGPRTRTVRIIPNIVNIASIQIDGEPIEGRTAQVVAGRSHTVTIVPGPGVRDRYQTTNDSDVIPTGSGEHDWRVAVQLQDAAIRVDAVSTDETRVHGSVSVEGRQQQGNRTGQIIYVRLLHPEENVTVRVRAMGYQDFVDRVALTAGQTEQVNARLLRSEVAEAP